MPLETSKDFFRTKSLKLQISNIFLKIFKLSLYFFNKLTLRDIPKKWTSRVQWLL